MPKRIGVLLAAIAVPAMAAPDNSTHTPQVIRFLMPEAVPYNQEYAALVDADLTELSEGMAQTKAMTADSEPLLTPHPGPAALPFAGYLGHADGLKAEECLAMAIYYEAASEGLAGQQAVAQVVMNRVRHPAWPNSVCGVVFQGSERTTGCQFTFTCDGSLARKPNASGMARARAVARAALGGYVFRPVGLATHYHRIDVYPYWAASLREVGTIGLHRFYRWGGTAGLPAAFSASYAGGETIAMPQGAIRTARQAGAESILEGITNQAAVAIALPAPADVSAPSQAHSTASVIDTIRPGSGTVLEPYARSGQWLVSP